jgi:hypothetical protein
LTSDSPAPSFSALAVPPPRTSSTSTTAAGRDLSPEVVAALAVMRGRAAVEISTV